MKRPLNEMETFRAQELLYQRATEGLDEREAAELAALGVEDDISFDLAAAAVDIATYQGEELPIGIADKVLIAAGVEAPQTTVMPAMTNVPTTLAGFVPPKPIVTSPQPAVEAPAASEPMRTIGTPGEPLPTVEPHTPTDHPPVPVPVPAPVTPITAAPKKTSRAVTYAVVAMAASLALAAGAVVWGLQQRGGDSVATTPTAAEARAELLASAKDVTTLSWTATKDPNAQGASGDVVWSASAQKGYMRFVGLLPNDAKAIQYQLWIFDKERDQAFPVDGGVFDVTSNGEVIIPITAKLRVDQPVLFAVTIEKPGGVVVSKRERIVVTAAPKA